MPLWNWSSFGFQCTVLKPRYADKFDSQNILRVLYIRLRVNVFYLVLSLTFDRLSNRCSYRRGAQRNGDIVINLIEHYYEYDLSCQNCDLAFKSKLRRYSISAFQRSHNQRLKLLGMRANESLAFSDTLGEPFCAFRSHSMTASFSLFIVERHHS